MSGCAEVEEAFETFAGPEEVPGAGVEVGLEALKQCGWREEEADGCAEVEEGLETRGTALDLDEETECWLEASGLRAWCVGVADGRAEVEEELET